MSDFLERVRRIAGNRAARGDVWGAICATTYADTIALNRAMADVEDITINGKLVSSTPVPQDHTARGLVEAMRSVMLNALPEDHRERVSELFGPLDFFGDTESPSTRVLADALRKRTEGLKPHAYKARIKADSRVHARAAIKMSKAGVDDVDIHAAVRASDLAVFEFTSVDYSLSHADWQLEGHSVRMELAEEKVSQIDPGVDKDILRKALREQFDGVDFTDEDLEWVIN